MKQKHLYTAPEADLLVVRFEENFVISGPGSGYDETGNAGVDLFEQDVFNFIF